MLMLNKNPRPFRQGGIIGGRLLDSLFCGKATPVASVHRTVALDGFESHFDANKKTTPKGVVFLLAEDEGFEPPQTESESGVLPLHKSSMNGGDNRTRTCDLMRVKHAL